MAATGSFLQISAADRRFNAQSPHLGQFLLVLGWPAWLVSDVRQANGHCMGQPETADSDKVLNAP
jgi:hypothetical protein